MAKKVAAIVTDLVEDVELTSPKEALEKAGHTVTLIGFEGNQTIKGKKAQNSQSNKVLQMFLLKTSMRY